MLIPVLTIGLFVFLVIIIKQMFDIVGLRDRLEIQMMCLEKNRAGLEKAYNQIDETRNQVSEARTMLDEARRQHLKELEELSAALRVCRYERRSEKTDE